MSYGYPGRDNYITLSFFKDGALVDPSVFTNLGLKVGGVEYKRSERPALFVTAGQAVNLVPGEVDLPAGQYQSALVVYTVDYPNGLVWVPDFPLTIWRI